LESKEEIKEELIEEPTVVAETESGNVNRDPYVNDLSNTWNGKR